MRPTRPPLRMLPILLIPLLVKALKIAFVLGFAAIALVALRMSPELRLPSTAFTKLYFAIDYLCE